MTAGGVSPTPSYTITIPSALNVTTSGWNATEGISVKGTSNIKTLSVTAKSANGWALKSGDNAISYKLVASSTDTEATTSWVFEKLDENTDTTKPMGIIVEDYSAKPAGTYTDTVTFTASIESTITIQIKGESGDSVELTYAEWDTWGDLVKKNSDKIEEKNQQIFLKSDKHEILKEKNNASTPVKVTDQYDLSKSYEFEDTTAERT